MISSEANRTDSFFSTCVSGTAFIASSVKILWAYKDCKTTSKWQLSSTILPLICDQVSGSSRNKVSEIPLITAKSALAQLVEHFGQVRPASRTTKPQQKEPKRDEDVTDL